jgi:hypothetical protein
VIKSRIATFNFVKALLHSLSEPANAFSASHRALPTVLQVERVVQSNNKSVEEGGEWFTKSILGKEQGLRSALFNSHLMNIPSDVLFAKYIDHKFLNLQEVTLLDSKSKTYDEESFSQGLSPRRYADFLLSKKIAIVQLELFQSNELLPISLSTLSACLLIEWAGSEEREALKV